MTPVCKCGRITDFIEEGKVQVRYSPKFRDFSIPLKDGIVVQLIEYCPWCGDKLPESLRERWFDEVEAMGFDEPFVQYRLDPNFPEEYKSDAWWKNNPDLSSD